MTPTLLGKKCALAISNLILATWTLTGGFAINTIYISISCYLKCKEFATNCVKQLTFLQNNNHEANAFGLILVALLNPIISLFAAE